MRKKRSIMLAAVLAAGLGGLLWLLFFSGEPEPVYQGKRLTKWLEVSGNPTNALAAKKLEDATNAVRHIGTNAIPTLLRMMRARDSALTLKLLALAEKQHFIRIHHVPASVRHREAQIAFSALGAEARDAVPALMEIYQQNISWESRMYTATALVSIGSDAKAAVPMLLRVATATNSVGQFDSAGRCYAIIVLGQIHAEPELVVPALTKVLSDPDGSVRVYAPQALGAFGPEAKTAVPALFELLKDKVALVGRSAAEAIKKIDPEAAAQRKAEIDAALASVKPQSAVPVIPPRRP